MLLDEPFAPCEASNMPERPKTYASDPEIVPIAYLTKKKKMVSIYKPNSIFLPKNDHPPASQGERRSSHGLLPL